MMKQRVRGITHQAVLAYLMKQTEPQTINQIARKLGTNRNEMLVRIDTLTFYNPQITEDENGRVYFNKEASDE